MNFKNLWLMFSLIMLTVVPTKIYGMIKNIDIINSIIFDVSVVVILAFFIIFTSFIKLNKKNIDVKKNYFLGIISIPVFIQFFICIPTYWNDTSKYDFAWQPLLMSFLSALSCITFILLAITFFTGKNIINKAPFFLYCPILWYGLYLLIFMSIYTNHVNPYEVVAAAFVSLFLLYNTQVFSTSSNINIIKIMFVFGIPAIILASINGCYRLLEIKLNYSVAKTSNSAPVATSILQLFLAAYILFTLIDAYIQYDKSNDPVIKSVTL
ncbi:MAG: hypothetical protein IJJ04_02795 [Clostridia bacterium]|nr:hypothetical protein [Clostridia bacterium]